MIFCLGRMVPSKTRTSITTPRYESYQESKTIALSGAAGSPRGGGTRFTICSRISSMPMPSLADAGDRVRGVEADHVLDLAAHRGDVGARAGRSC